MGWRWRETYEAYTARLWRSARTALRNPHFWALLTASAVLLFFYQAWPWQEVQFVHGFWKHFSWLSQLGWLPVGVEIPAGIFGILFLLPIIYGSVTLSWPGGLLAWLLSMSWALPELSNWSAKRLPTNLLLLFLPVLLAAVVSGQRRSREIEKKVYREREREQELYVAKLVESQEAERRRIALEIHDDTLQTLLAITNRLGKIESSPPGPKQTEGVRWAKERLFQSMDDLRRLSVSLRPNVLDNFGLVAGVRWLVDNTAQSECRITTLVKGEVCRMSNLAEVSVFRIVQECLSNIHRHAQAENATVTLEFDRDHLTVDVQDDGIGFDYSGKPFAYIERNRLGLVGIEQRIAAAGGQLDLQSGPGRGTRLRATIPYSASEEFV